MFWILFLENILVFAVDDQQQRKKESEEDPWHGYKMAMEQLRCNVEADNPG